MNTSDRIKVGDTVRVMIDRTLVLNGVIVLSIPCATGDSWVFSDPVDGELNYISEGCTVTRFGTERAAP